MAPRLTFVTFRSYGMGSNDVTIVAERITHIESFTANGNHGSRICLDTGKEIQVQGFRSDIEHAVEKALAKV